MTESASPADWIRIAPPQPGLERMEAYFAGHAFDPHRHDTYAVGLTLSGVQSTDYRGMTEHSTAGRVLVLHPDERHDGRAGADGGFRYRMLYLDPGLVRDALGSTRRPLPFVGRAISDDPELVAAAAAALDDLATPMESLQADHTVLRLTDALARLDPATGAPAVGATDRPGLTRARELLCQDLDRPLASPELEAATGLDRFVLARQFRWQYGTSPYRFRLMRRLDRARRLMLEGISLSETAADCGFADQSHMTRQFHRAYGVPPGRWLARCRLAAAVSR